MWFPLVYNGLASSVDNRFWSVDMLKNEYWFRVVSVPDMYETTRFRRRSHKEDPNRVAEDEKTSDGVTTTEHPRRMW